MAVRPKTVCLLLVLALFCEPIILAQSSDPSTQVYRPGHGVTPPRPIYYPDPEYSEEARTAHYEGTVTLMIVVDTDGKPTNLRVANSLGMGLDEKALETVRTWRFEPGMKDGHPVRVSMAVQVDFHFHDSVPSDPKAAKLMFQANLGDAWAQLGFAHACFEGKGMRKNDALGEAYLRRAANQGLPRAQFELGDRLVDHDPPDYPNAYMWLTLAQRYGYRPSDKVLKSLSAKMTSDQIQRGRALAGSWTPRRE